MSRFHPHSFPLPTVVFSALSFFLATTQAQMSYSPATAEACNGPNYPCVGYDACCPLPAVCLPSLFGAGLRSACLKADGFDVNGGAGGIPGGGGLSLTINPLGGGFSPVVIPTTLPPVVPAGSSASLAGAGIVTSSSFPPSPPTTSTPLRSTSTSSFSTSTPPVPSPTIPGGGTVGGNGNGAVIPVTPLTNFATSILPSSSSAARTSGSGGGGGGGGGAGGGNGSGGGGQTPNNGGAASGSGSASNGTSGANPTGARASGNGTGTFVFTGAAVPRSSVGIPWWCGLIVTAAVIAGVGACAVE